MKLFVVVAVLASAACMISAKKLLVVGGLNTGALGLNPGALGLNPGVLGLNPGVLGVNPGVLGVNPGVLGVNPGVLGVNPGVLGLNGGFNPALIGGGGPFIAQPPIGQMFPVIPPYMFQPQLGIPNAPPQLPQQFPFQPNGGMPFLPPVNRQVLPPQQQAVGQMNPGGNGQQPQGDMPTGPALRFRRALWQGIQDNSVAQVTSSPATSERPDE